MVRGAADQFSPPAPSRREPGAHRLCAGGAGLGLVLTAVLLSACGGSQTAAPPPAATPSSSAAAKSPPPSAAGDWTAEGASFGVDRARWPTDAAGAKVVLDRLPQSFAGQTLQSYANPREDDSGPTAGGLYGEEISVYVSEEYLTDDTEDGSRELFRARDLLAANFMLGLSCSEDSYRGNALPLTDDGYPSVPRGKPIWFSCAVDGAEGDDDFTAHAAGWTSGKTAWLVLAPDSDTVRSLVTALHDATS